MRLHLVLVAAFLAFLAPAGASAQIDPGLIPALRAGGTVIVLRHGATNPDQADTNPLDPSDRGKQRHLNDNGRAAAKAMGEALRALKVPVGQVTTSVFHRAVETGQLLGFGEVTTTTDIAEGGLVVSPAENNRRDAALKKLAATPPPAGTNVILVTHKPNIMDAFGKDWFDVREGEASIFQPDGKGGYKPIARILAGDWSKLAQASN